MTQQIREVARIVAPYTYYYPSTQGGGALTQSWFLREEQTFYETGERTIVSNIPTPANEGFVTLIRRYDSIGTQLPDQRIDHAGIYPPATEPPLTLN
jgi:hypothetical protein